MVFQSSLVKKMKPCWILTTPRSGSTYLSRRLNQTGFFNPPFAEWYNSETLFEKSYIQNPVAFCKIHRFQYDEHKPLFPKDVLLVHLTRKDLVEATVSQYFAGHTKVWNTTCEDKLLDHANIDVPYDKNVMLRLYFEMAHESKGWIEFLKDKEFLEFDYEDLTNDIDSIVDEIVKISGVGSNERNKYQHMHTPLKMYHPLKEDYVQRLRKMIKQIENN